MIILRSHSLHSYNVAATGYSEAINKHLRLTLAIAAGKTFLPCVLTLVCFVERLSRFSKTVASLTFLVWQLQCLLYESLKA